MLQAHADHWIWQENPMIQPWQIIRTWRLAILHGVNWQDAVTSGCVVLDDAKLVRVRLIMPCHVIHIG
jgi:hypothetical protein